MCVFQISHTYKVIETLAMHEDRGSIVFCSDDGLEVNLTIETTRNHETHWVMSFVVIHGYELGLVTSRKVGLYGVLVSLALNLNRIPWDMYTTDWNMCTLRKNL